MIERRRSAHAQAAAFVAAMCGLAAISMLMANSSRRVVLRSDPDAPNRIDLAFAARMHHAQVHEQGHRGDLGALSNANLKRENSQLRKEVAKLEGELHGHAGNRRMHARGHESAALQGLSARMQWAKEELKELKSGHAAPLQARGPRSIKTVKLSGAADENVWPGKEPWVRTEHNGEQLKSMTTPDGDVNPISQLKPGDYWKDPYDRPFLHAPNPHDPASTLAKTTTGDYASPATWGEIYHSKETIDWCTSYFPYFSDRIRCIEKLHAQGPLLG